MTAIVTAVAPEHRFFLTAALTDRLVGLGNAAWPAPNEIGPISCAAINCRSPL